MTNNLANVQSEALTHSAVSVVNALATGKGSAFGVDIECRVKAKLIERGGSDSSIEILSSSTKDEHNLIFTSARYALRAFGRKENNNLAVQIGVDSKIPPAVGLKSSSAVSVGVVKALSLLLSPNSSANNILRLSCKASIACGSSITGAYDDASACLLGGLVLTDNTHFRLLRHQRVPQELGNIVCILVPIKRRRFTSSIDLKVYSPFREESKRAFEYVRRGEVSEAMLLNSMVQCAALHYSFEPVSSALSEGASAVGITGKGPAVAAVCTSDKIARRIKSSWLEEFRESRVIVTRVVQPSK